MIKRETSYEAWLREEGIPVVGGYGVQDVTALPRKPVSEAVPDPRTTSHPT